MPISPRPFTLVQKIRDFRMISKCYMIELWRVDYQ